MKRKTFVIALLIGITLSGLSPFVQLWGSLGHTEPPVYSYLAQLPDVSLPIWNESSTTTKDIVLGDQVGCAALPSSTAYGAPLPYAVHTQGCSGDDNLTIKLLRTTLNILFYTLVCLGVIALMRKFYPAK